MSVRRFGFDELPYSDLIIDAIYEGGAANNISDDPLGRLTHWGNQGGFRKAGGSRTK